MKTDSMNSVNILIVDDNDLVLETLNLLISSNGHICHVANDGLEAAHMLVANSYDLVVTDVKMPRMNGVELLQRIKRHHPDTDVIITTGYSKRASYSDAIEAGAIDYINKPINHAELKAKLARALRDRTMRLKLEQLSIHDNLTSLFNMQGFDIHLAREIERAARQRYPIFLATLNIDNFKEYIDKHGHQSGDELLLTFVKILTDCTRNSVDTCCRTGESTFSVILPQTNGDQATEIVQRILLKFVECCFDITSLSIGVVSCKRDPLLTLEANQKQIKKSTDQAIHDARKDSKNSAICRI